MTLSDLFNDRIGISGQRVFLVDAFTGREITYAQFHEQAVAVAAYLREHGVSRGDRVATIVPNCTELAALYVGCLYLGATIVPVNPNLSSSEAQYILANCCPKCTVVSSSARQKFASLLDRSILISISQDLVTSSPDPVIDLNQLESPSALVPFSESAADDLALIVYTSGTTARPKGLAHQLGHMVRNATVFAEAQAIDSDSRFYLTLSMASSERLSISCCFLSSPDPAWCSITSSTRARVSRSGGEPRDSASTAVARAHCSFDSSEDGSWPPRRRILPFVIRKTFVGFAPLPARVKAEFEARYGIALTENYGLSETLFVTARSKSLAGIARRHTHKLAGFRRRAFARNPPAPL